MTRINAMECSMRELERELDRTRAELADALRLSPAEFQRLRDEKDAEINKLGNECGHLEADNREIQAELADARKAAESLYTSLLAGFSREEIVKSALERWPWLGPPEPEAVKPAPKYCDTVTRREITCGHPLPCPHHPVQSSEAPLSQEGKS